MNRPFSLVRAAAILGLAWSSVLPASAQSPVHLTLAYPSLVLDDNASAAATVPDGSGRVVVGLQRGQLRVLPLDREAKEAPMFLDLRERMKEETDFEEGIHGLAFHPAFSKTRRVYLCYSQRGPRRTVLSEFMVPEGETFRADPKSERILMEYPHPLGNHWGGGIAFGPDGFLYVGIGDGGLRDDPYRLSQNLWSLHGKILRLDVDGRSAGLAYGIPRDNPFVDRQEVRDEIWAAGLRNPWGMSFDRATGTLWCGDVGQDRWEEINVIQRGANYGWSEREGPGRFANRETTPEEGGPFADPVHSYPHTEGLSVTGGYVYRGRALPSLRGQYLFADWVMGKIWALPAGSEGKGPVESRLIFSKEADQAGFNPTVFTPDAAGEPLIFSHHPSVIYTLKEKNHLAASDEGDAESPPTPESSVEEIIESPSAIEADVEASLPI